MKKGKRDLKKKKPRVPRIGLDFGRATTMTGMQENEDGSVTFFGHDGKVLPVDSGFTSLAYYRAKGPKVTVQIPDHGHSMGSLSSALACFTRIVGVDTNSTEHDGEKIYATAVCELSDVRFEGPRWWGHIDPVWALEFRHPTKDSERIGWRHVLARGEELGWLTGDSNLLLVVDSHLADLDKINQRQASIIDDFVLPHSVSIAYASSDAAGDSPLNGLIACCDRTANQVLSHATSSSTALSPLFRAHGTPFQAHRYWKFADA